MGHGSTTTHFRKFYQLTFSYQICYIIDVNHGVNGAGMFWFKFDNHLILEFYQTVSFADQTNEPYNNM